MFQQESTFFDSRKGAVDHISRAIMAITRNTVSIGDTPTAELFVDLSLLAPQAISIFTFRNPIQWAIKRVMTHSNEILLCSFNLWEHEKVLHPFDLIGCLEACPSCRHPFVSLHELIYGEPFSKFKRTTKSLTSPDVSKRLQRLQAAYIRMNTVNMMIAAQREVLPLCLWDMVNSSSTTEALAITIRDFLQNSSLKTEFSGLSIHHSRPPRYNN